MKNKKLLILIISICFISINAFSQVIFLKSPVDYEMHASNLKSLGYTVQSYNMIPSKGGYAVVTVTSNLSRIPFNQEFGQGTYGAYSTGAIVNYICSFDEKTSITVKSGSLAQGHYSFINFSGNLNYQAIQSNAKETLATALNTGYSALQTNESICKNIKLGASYK